ncbi:MAG: tRNA (adenosine(37)-N6)-threonylcarbamoyltransferase complex dimerization subunit type 1 TsaB [Candidatus Saccharibacteria bacterium]
MILLLDTSTPVCRLALIDAGQKREFDWESNRELAKGLLGYLDKTMKSIGKTWVDISAIGVFEGPGSFTGLRIGITVANTIADAQNIPIVGGRGDDWQTIVLSKLNAGENEKLVLPFYGGEANITVPRK